MMVGVKLALIVLLSEAVHQVSADDAAASGTCPPMKPHWCPPFGSCYGPYYYCSSASRTVEPCVKADHLKDETSRKKLCQEIAQGKNVTEMIRDPSCNMRGDCFSEFGLQLYPSDHDNQNSRVWFTAFWVLFAVVVGLIVTAAIYFWKKVSKRSTETVNEVEMGNELQGNHTGQSVVNKTAANHLNQTQLSEEPESNNTGDQTEYEPLILRETGDAENLSNVSAESGISSSPVITTPTVSTVTTMHSNQSSVSSIASSGGEHHEERREESQNGTPSDRTHGVHPAEIESNQQRALHMPSTEPSNVDQHTVVTNQTRYILD